MKQLLLIVALSIVSIKSVYPLSNANFLLTVDLPDFAGQKIDLGYYYGNKILLKDQLKLDSEGKTLYKDIDHEGIYFLRLTDSTSFEFMITQPGYYSFHSANGIITIRGNAACEAYDNYLHGINNIVRQTDSIQHSMKSSNDISVIQAMRLKIAQQRDKIDSLTVELVNKYKGELLGNYAKALLPVSAEGFFSDVFIQGQDSLTLVAELYNYKKHYFDNIAFNDARLIYTPVIEDKINNYLDRIVVHNVDSICQALDMILSKSSDSTMIRFIASTLLYKYGKQKHKNPEELVFMHLVENFYLTPKAFWLSKKEIKFLSEEYKRRQRIQTGNIAPEIELSDMTGRRCSLYAIQSEITILLFWDFSCPNCRKILQDFIDLTQKYHYIDMKIYSIYTGSDLDVWKAWNYKKLPATWINTYQLSSDPVTHTYSITNVPTIIILDTNKVIVRKNITVPELDEYLFHLTG